MHRLFEIMELMREIAVYLGVPEWGALVSVSRRWHLVVLPLLWRRVDFGVFSAFGSFERDNDSGYYTVSCFKVVSFFDSVLYTSILLKLTLFLMCMLSRDSSVTTRGMGSTQSWIVFVGTACWSKSFQQAFPFDVQVL